MCPRIKIVFNLVARLTGYYQFCIQGKTCIFCNPNELKIYSKIFSHFTMFVLR